MPHARTARAERAPARLAVLAAALGLSTGVLLSTGGAAGPEGPAAPRPPGGRVVIGVRGDVSSFNVYTAAEVLSQEVADLLFLRLAREQDDFAAGPPSFLPGLAASWEFSADRTSLTFRLDPNARWSDGSPVTAQDVLLSHRAARSPEVAWPGIDTKEFIADARAPDDRTVVLSFSRTYPYQLMDAAEGNVLPAAVYGKVPFAEWPKRAFLDAPLASGPFVLKRYERGSLIDLVRNPRYHRAPLPGLDAVVFRIIPDEEALLGELLSGGIDVMENVPPRARARVEASPRLRIERTPMLSYGFICWNVSRRLFADARVRRALTMVVDRDAILETLLPGVGRPSAGPILSSLWAHDPSVTPPPYDPPAARRLLREAGWEDADGDGVFDRAGRPFRFELESNQGSSLRASIAEMVSAQLRKVGVEAVHRVLETGAFIARHEAHDFDAFVGSYRESTKVDLRSNFHSAARTGGLNYGMYVDAELDEFIDRARPETDPAAARALWSRAQRIVARDQPYTFLFERDVLHAFPRRLEGVRVSPRSAYVNVEEWRWAPEEKAPP